MIGGCRNSEATTFFYYFTPSIQLLFNFLTLFDQLIFLAVNRIG